MGRRRGRRGGFRHWLGGRLELPVSACTMHSRTPQPSRLPGSGADRAPRWPVSCPLCPAGSGGEWLRLGQTPNPPTPWGRPGDREGKAGKGPPPPHTNRTRGAGHFWGGGCLCSPGDCHSGRWHLSRGEQTGRGPGCTEQPLTKAFLAPMWAVPVGGVQKPCGFAALMEEKADVTLPPSSLCTAVPRGI